MKLSLGCTAICPFSKYVYLIEKYGYGGIMPADILVEDISVAYWQSYFVVELAIFSREIDLKTEYVVCVKLVA